MERSKHPADDNSLDRSIKKQRVNDTHTTLQPPSLKLRFINSPPPIIFTFSKIVAEDDSPIAIELVDAATNTRVTTDSIVVSLELVAVNADIPEESLITKDFQRYILQPRKGNRPLLVGDLTVKLRDGVGVIAGNVAFTDNSSWTRSGKFRLGVKSTTKGVMEAITRAFFCKDKRGESYKKLYHLYPDAEIWKLNKMGKNGTTHSHLRQAGINTVKDFRRYLAINSSAIHPCLEGKISEKKWNAMVSHAMLSVSDKSECYRYKSKAHKGVLLFNSMYEVMKVSFDGITALNPIDLTSTQQGLLDNFQQEAHQNTNRFIRVNNEDFLNFLPSSQLDTGVSSSASTDYDVVIIREDVSHYGFINHLRAALSRRGITVHKDFEEVNEVPECRVLIIFFTSTYVPSNLVNILEHQLMESRIVYPIFYGILPSELISNSKNYESFFLHEEPIRWHTALMEITQMSGYTLIDKSESELIDEIVRDVWKVLSSSDKVDMFGIDMQIKEILSLLCIESPDVRSLGIWGPVGIGKTTIAEEIFRRISVHYETCVFLKDFHEEVEVKGLDAMREDFLSKILEVDSHVIRVSDMKSSFMESRLQRKRILVILDDVNDSRDVETFIGKLKHFGPGSKVIITSRNRRIFVQCKVDHVYEVKPLDISKSLLLLKCGKYWSVSPHTTNILHELVKFSNGNPQVLQFLMSSREGQRLTQQIQKKSPIYIPGIFEKICYGLDDNERSIFLDIVCFFTRMDKDSIAMLLDACGFSTHVGLRSLVDKSLLTISHKNMVDMHGFIQATGQEIVRREAADRPGDRSRLWNSAEISDVFFGNTGTSDIEGIFLDMSKVKLDAKPYVLQNMCNLRLIKFYCSEVIENRGVFLPEGLEYLPNKLRLLHWEYYPLSSLPKSFDPKNLVELNLPNSSTKKLWKGKKSLEKLKKMRLSYSYQLTKLPKLSSAPNLEHIDLEGCNSLVSISQSICYLKKLVFLNLKNCSNLESVPSTVDLESLEVLNLSGCSKLESFPEISPNVKELYLGGTMIQEIPSSIKNLVLLEKLDLENCRHLQNLPTSICKLKHLETLNLSGCSNLDQFPEFSRRMKCLRYMDLSRTSIKELPSSISYLIALEELRFVECKNLVKLPDKSLRFKVEFREMDKEKFSRLWNRF